jgi:hypothetical protein
MVGEGGEGLEEGAACAAVAAAAGIAEAVATIAPLAISERAQVAEANLGGNLNLGAASELRSECTGSRANISMTRLYVPY